jgi:putative transposase
LRKLTLSSAKSVRDLIHASVKTSCEQRFLHRLHCVLLIAEGRSCYEVARWFGEHPRTIERWVHALVLHDVEGLREHHAGGRPAKLIGEQAQRLALDLQKPPRLSGYPKREWSGKLLTQHLEGSYGLKLSVRQCQRLLRGLARGGAA